jgi:hypothetical protein
MMKMFRKFCGLLAAYAIVLQPFVVAMSSSSAAHAGFAAEICTSARFDTPAGPGGHANTECCTVMGCGAAAALPSVAGMASAQIAYVAVAPFVAAGLHRAWPSERPHSARAPPV